MQKNVQKCHVIARDLEFCISDNTDVFLLLTIEVAVPIFLEVKRGIRQFAKCHITKLINFDNN